MLYTSDGRIHKPFLQFTGSTLHHTTGLPISFIYPNETIEALHQFNTCKEPYSGYIASYLTTLKRKEMNKSHILYLKFSEVLLSHTIYNKGRFLGSLFIGPLKTKGLTETSASMNAISKDQSIQHYLNDLPLINQYQIQYLLNLINLTMQSTFYDPTIISSQQIEDISEDLNITKKLSGKIAHHTIEHEEKILQNILLSKENFVDIALKNLAKVSNLVAPPLASNPIRSEKNRFVVTATILSRAAIKLGVSSEKAFGSSDFFINQIENCNSLEEIWQMQLSLFQYYRKEVEASRNTSYYSASTNSLLLYVDERKNTSLSLQEICDFLGLDYKYASDRFKKDTGQGFNKYLTGLKIDEAKHKLSTSDETIQDISESLGFKNAYYFTRTFKKIIGLSPTEYRKQSINS